MKMAQSQTNIYILRLKGGKYYVGKTDNPLQRYQEHLEGRGSAWTRKHKPVEVVKVIPNASPFDEDKHVKECIAKYGIENVRGGSYSQVHLDEEQVNAVEREIRGASDACMRCGREGHFARDCYARTAVEVSSSSSKKSAVTCYRCGRSGHYASQCYAQTSADGEHLEDDSDDDDDDDDEDEDDEEDDEDGCYNDYD